MTRRCGLAGILVACIAFGGFADAFFTGSWESTIGLAPQQTQPFTMFESTLNVGISMEFIKIYSIADFIIDGWIWEELGIEADVGVLSFGGHVLYDPHTGLMDYAEGVLTVHAGPLGASLYGAVVGATETEPFNYGYVLDIRGDVYGAFGFESATYLGADLSGITFTASGPTTSSSVPTKTYVTDPTIDPVTAVFSGQEVTLKARLLGCLELSSLTSFSADGFESEQVTASLHRVFGTPLVVALALTFEIQTKSYTLSPSFESDFGCLFLYSSIAMVDNTIIGVDLHGVKLELTLGSATIESITNLDTTDYVITTPEFGSIVEPLVGAIAEGHLYYETDYWEILTLTVGVPPLEAGFSFSVRTYLSTADGLFFDWAQTSMALTLALGASVSASTTVTVDSTGFTGWSLSFCVRW